MGASIMSTDSGHVTTAHLNYNIKLAMISICIGSTLLIVSVFGSQWMSISVELRGTRVEVVRAGIFRYCIEVPDQSLAMSLQTDHCVDFLTADHDKRPDSRFTSHAMAGWSIIVAAACIGCGSALAARAICINSKHLLCWASILLLGAAFYCTFGVILYVHSVNTQLMTKLLKPLPGVSYHGQTHILWGIPVCCVGVGFIVLAGVLLACVPLVRQVHHVNTPYLSVLYRGVPTAREVGTTSELTPSLDSPGDLVEDPEEVRSTSETSSYV